MKMTKSENNSITQCARELHDTMPEKFEQLFQELDFYMIHRRRKNTDVLNIFKNDSPIESEEYMEYVWKNVKNLSESNWEVRILTTLFSGLIN